jgi:hypothetical protein
MDHYRLDRGIHRGVVRSGGALMSADGGESSALVTGPAWSGQVGEGEG